jgi:hypothetical protein
MDTRLVTGPWAPHPKPAPTESNPPDLTEPGEAEVRGALLARARAGDAEALRLVEERYRVRLSVVSPPVAAPTSEPPTPEAVTCAGCGQIILAVPRRQRGRKRHCRPSCREKARRKRQASA